MKITVQGFDWDDGNREKCLKHGLSVSKIEQFFQGEIKILGDPKHSQAEERFIAVGKTAEKKPIFVGFTYRMKGGAILIRPISARYMHEKEVKRYVKASSKIEE
jgi:uncharacterized protein